MGALVKFQAELQMQECCLCGTVFAMSGELTRMARERGPNRSFFCPNGHSQHFSKSRVTELEEELAAEKVKREAAERAAEFQRSQRDIDQRAATKREKKLAKRIANGVCPCCHRTFGNLAAHMKTKHPTHGNDPAQVS